MAVSKPNQGKLDWQSSESIKREQESEKSSPAFQMDEREESHGRAAEIDAAINFVIAHDSELLMRLADS